MITSLYLKAAQARLSMEELANNPLALVQKLERGDADSSGSTMRTAGVVALVLVVFLAIGGAVASLAEATKGQIATPAFK